MRRCLAFTMESNCARPHKASNISTNFYLGEGIECLKDFQHNRQQGLSVEPNQGHSSSLNGTCAKLGSAGHLVAGGHPGPLFIEHVAGVIMHDNDQADFLSQMGVPHSP